MFEYNTTIRLYDTDAAGVLFFANQFKLVHDAYESFLESLGLSVAYILGKTSFALPVVHAETNYSAPLMVGDNVKITLRVKRIGSTSFTISHQLFKNEDIPAGSGETVHISIDKSTHKKIPLPSQLIAKLKDK